MSASYTCPVCDEKMDRDLLALNRHADVHIVQEIQKSHPAWVTQDGYCPKCLDYFKRQMGKTQGTSSSGEEKSYTASNIGSDGVKRRRMLALVCFALSAMEVGFAKRKGFPASAEAFIFLPLFAGFLCWIQAREKVCVVLARRGTREVPGGGVEAILDPVLRKFLKQSSARILLMAAALAAAVTAIIILF